MTEFYSQITFQTPYRSSLYCSSQNATVKFVIISFKAEHHRPKVDPKRFFSKKMAEIRPIFRVSFKDYDNFPWDFHT